MKQPEKPNDSGTMPSGMRGICAVYAHSTCNRSLRDPKSYGSLKQIDDWMFGDWLAQTHVFFTNWLENGYAQCHVRIKRFAESMQLPMLSSKHYMRNALFVTSDLPFYCVFVSSSSKRICATPFSAKVDSKFNEKTNMRPPKKYMRDAKFVMF